MRVLLVDDEKYVLDELESEIDWKKYGDISVYKANNIRKAKNILDKITIDLILCDIVMPQGTGFDLLSWVRERELQTEVIFLTSYADFSYAKQAIELECIDYLVKPVDYQKLDEVLEKSFGKVRKTHTLYNWLQTNKRYIKEELFRTLLLTDQYKNAESMIRLPGYDTLDYESETVFRPVFIHLYIGHTEQNLLQQEEIRFMLCNIMEELMSNSDCSLETVIDVDKQKFLAFIRPQSEMEEVPFKAIMEKVQFWIHQNLSYDIWIGMGERCELKRLSEYISKIMRFRESNLSNWNCVDVISAQKSFQVQYINDKIKIWEVLLGERREEELKESIFNYLEELEKRSLISSDILIKFRTDLLQILYSYLKEHEVMAHMLFDNEWSNDFYQRCQESCKGAKEFTEYYISKTLEYMNISNSSDTIADIIAEYIDSHYMHNITREELAKVVFLNPDYLAKVFKKEKGVSTKAYITRKRMECAKDYISNSNMPIQSVAMNVGYSNFAYFAKMFKDYTGFTPIEYRKQNG